MPANAAGQSQLCLATLLMSRSTPGSDSDTQRCHPVNFSITSGLNMRNFFTALLGACFLIMTNSANADSGPTLLLDTTKGQVEIRMLPDLAPNHVARITELATSGFYDGVLLHRVIPRFLAQPGDPDGTSRPHLWRRRVRLPSKKGPPPRVRRWTSMG